MLIAQKLSNYRLLICFASNILELESISVK